MKEENQSSPEPKSEDSDSSDPKNNARMHCRALVLAHSKSFVLSLFVALHFDSFIHASDIQSAMDQCEESITEIDITNYMMVSMVWTLWLSWAMLGVYTFSFTGEVCMEIQNKIFWVIPNWLTPILTYPK